MASTYSWTHEDTSLTVEVSSTLTLSPFSTGDLGTYDCAVENNGQTGMGSATVELGGWLVFLLIR